MREPPLSLWHAADGFAGVEAALVGQGPHPAPIGHMVLGGDMALSVDATYGAPFSIAVEDG